MDGRIGRRSFLGVLAAGSVTLIGARVLAVPGSAPRVADRIRAPGDVVDVDWPGSLDRARVRFVHRVDSVFLGVEAAPGLWHTDVRAHGHLGGGHASKTVGGVEVAALFGFPIGPVELSLRLGHAWFELPALPETYYAVGGPGGGILLGLGFGFRHVFGGDAAR